MPTPRETVSTNANAILDQAAALDSLISQFRVIAADIGQRELAISKAMYELNPNKPLAQDGQRRLALYAHSRMLDQSAGRTVADLAAAAWRGWL
jgi:hypothetical protein